MASDGHVQWQNSPLIEIDKRSIRWADYFMCGVKVLADDRSARLLS